MFRVLNISGLIARLVLRKWLRLIFILALKKKRDPPAWFLKGVH